MSKPARLTLCLLLSLGLSACGTTDGDYADESSPATGMIRLANQIMAKGDAPGAADFYQRALQRDPENLQALVEYGAVMERLGRYDVAAEQYQAALRQRPHDAELLRHHGRTLLALDKPAEAKEEYEKALDRNDEDPKAMNGLGIALDYLGDHEGAQKNFLAVLKEDPHNLNTINNLAYSYILSGDLASAIEQLEPYQKDRAASPSLRQNLALAYGLAGMDLDAERVAKMDLPPAQVKANMAYYHRKRAEISVSKIPYAELGSYATEAMAEVQIAKLKNIGIAAELTPVVTPEVATPGGTPRFVIRLTSCQNPEEVQKLCKELPKQGIPCVMRQP